MQLATAPCLISRESQIWEVLMTEIKFPLLASDADAFFLQSLPLKGLMKFLPNLLSIICGCQTLKRMMNAVHCGVYVHSKKVQRSLSKSMAVDPPKKNLFLEIFLFEIWPSVQCMQVPCKSVGWRRPRRGRRTTAAASQKINTVSCHPYCQEVLRFFL